MQLASQQAQAVFLTYYVMGRSSPALGLLCGLAVAVGVGSCGDRLCLLLSSSRPRRAGRRGVVGRGEQALLSAAGTRPGLASGQMFHQILALTLLLTALHALHLCNTGSTSLRTVT